MLMSMLTSPLMKIALCLPNCHCKILPLYILLISVGIWCALVITVDVCLRLPISVLTSNIQDREGNLLHELRKLITGYNGVRGVWQKAKVSLSFREVKATLTNHRNNTWTHGLQVSTLKTKLGEEKSETCSANAIAQYRNRVRISFHSPTTGLTWQPVG